MTKIDATKVRAAIAALEAARMNVEIIKDGLQTKHDEKSERWQDSEAAERQRDLISHLEDAISNVESAERDLRITIQGE